MAKQDTDVITRDELNEFCQQLVFHSQYKSTRRFQTGSSIEIENNGGSMTECGLKLDRQDADYTFYCINQYAFPREQLVPTWYSGIVYRIYTDGVHPGYAKLIEENNGTEQTHFVHFANSDNFVGHGPAVQYNQLAAFSDTLANDAILRGRIPLQDNVRATHCPYWPVEASEWITRTRRHACPPKSVIKQVVRYGCDFVGIAHRHTSSVEYLSEWRISFTRAELFIIRSWTNEQRIVYRVLRLIHKLIEDIAAEKGNETSLRTYYFKTLMLWECENRPKEFWIEESFVCLIQQLLSEMLKWVKQRKCCNHFIPANNMMDHLMDTDVSGDAALLLGFSTDENVIAFLVERCSRDEKEKNNTENNYTYQADLPTNIYRSLLLLDRISNPQHNYEDLDSHEYSPELRTALLQELADIYRGLVCQAKADTEHQRSEQCIRQAERYFISAASQCRALDRVCVYLNGFRSVGYIINMYMRYDAAAQIVRKLTLDRHIDEQVSSTTNMAIALRNTERSRSLLYSRTSQQLVKTKSFQSDGTLLPEGCGAVSLSIFETYKVTGDTDVYSFREWPRLSPTVNMSWFIAKAYLANLYFIEDDHDAAIKTCNDIVGVYKHSLCNKHYADNGFSVVLSSQWAQVFDKDLQMMLGWYVLCKFVSNRTGRRSLYLALCPVQFALYLKARCAMYQTCASDVEDCVKNYKAHITYCYFYDRKLSLDSCLTQYYSAMRNLDGFAS